MTVNEVNVTLLNKGVNRNTAISPITWGVTGTCTGLAAGQFLSVSKNTLPSLGVGPGASLAAILINQGASVVDFVSAKSGTAPTITFAAGASNTGAMIAPTVSGTAVDGPWCVRIEIVIGGLAAACSFRYSFDDGLTWVQTVKGSASAITLYCRAVNTASQVSSGISITLGTGSANVGDTFSAIAFPAPIGAYASDGDGSIKDAYNQFASKGKKYSHIAIANEVNSSTTTTNALAVTALSTLLTSGSGEIDVGISALKTNDIPAETIVCGPTDVALADEYITTAAGMALLMSTTLANQGANGTYTYVTHGHVCMQDPLIVSTMWRSVGWHEAVRFQANNSTGRTIYEAIPLSLVAPGRAPGLSILGTAAKDTKRTYTGLQQYGFTHDERVASNINGGTYGVMAPVGIISTSTSAESDVPQAAYFICQNTHSDPSNDFFEGAYMEQINILQRFVNPRMWKLYKGKQLDCNADGTITEKQARQIEATINDAIIEGLVKPGYLPGMPQGVNQNYVIIDRTVNLVSTQTLTWDAGFYPKGIVKLFSVRMSLFVKA